MSELLAPQHSQDQKFLSVSLNAGSRNTIISKIQPSPKIPFKQSIILCFATYTYTGFPKLEGECWITRTCSIWKPEIQKEPWNSGRGLWSLLVGWCLQLQKTTLFAHLHGDFNCVTEKDGTVFKTSVPSEKTLEDTSYLFLIQQGQGWSYFSESIP